MQLPPLAGEVRWGTKVQLGYYAQQLDDLDDRNEIIMELRRVAPPSATAGELRSFLAKFLFKGDDVYKLVRDLSGGEKGRLALAKLIYSRVNVLVLDEPTNHLDIPSREALEEALDAYEGTILTISHDRYFLDRVATQILALDGEGNAEHYDGDYTEYHDWKLSRIKGNASSKSTQVSELVSVSDWAHSEESPGLQVESESERSTARGLVAQRKGRGKAAKTKAANATKVKVVKKARSPAVIEAEIAEHEQRLTTLSEEMAKPEVSRDITRLVAVNDEYKETESRLSELMQEWERAEAPAG